MPENSFQKRFFQEYAALLQETFEHSGGIYLDKGTSLFETLAAVTAEEASQPLPGGATAAAHVDHARLYLSVLEDHMQNKPTGNIDWEEIWRAPRSVTPAEWDDLRQSLQEAYRRVAAVMARFDTWDGENEMNGALAILAHSAYHLGAIRQILFMVRERR